MSTEEPEVAGEARLEHQRQQPARAHRLLRQEETTSDVFLNRPGSDLSTGTARHQFKENGGQNYVGKYTSFITDNFTLSALYGHGEFARRVAFAHGERLASRLTAATSRCRPPAARIIVGRPSGLPPQASTERSPARATLRQLPSRRHRSCRRRRYARPVPHRCRMALGAHLLRAGYDLDDYESVAGHVDRRRPHVPLFDHRSRRHREHGASSTSCASRSSTRVRRSK